MTLRQLLREHDCGGGPVRKAVYHGGCAFAARPSYKLINFSSSAGRRSEHLKVQCVAGRPISSRIHACLRPTTIRFASELVHGNEVGVAVIVVGAISLDGGVVHAALVDVR